MSWALIQFTIWRPSYYIKITFSNPFIKFVNVFMFVFVFTFVYTYVFVLYYFKSHTYPLKLSASHYSVMYAHTDQCKCFTMFDKLEISWIILNSYHLVKMSSLLSQLCHYHLKKHKQQQVENKLILPILLPIGILLHWWWKDLVKFNGKDLGKIHVC